MNTYYVYILTNNSLKVLYIGITNNLTRRIVEHKNGTFSHSFTSKYKVNRLVYFETYQDVNEAIAREKQLKSGSRLKKVKLIESMNPLWEEIET